jgi:hypothetical protein
MSHLKSRAGNIISLNVGSFFRYLATSNVCKQSEKRSREMTLYIENAVNFPEAGSISLNGVWHPNAALLAVASFSQEKGGFVTIFDELVR